jgi:putative hydrolase of the HAD superfamily
LTEPLPHAVLFDLFHTLVRVPSAESIGETPVPELLGVPADEWYRRFYDEDVSGRCIGRVEACDAMRRVTHSMDPAVPEERIRAAVESRRRCFGIGLVEIEPETLSALDRLRAAGVRIGLVSDAAADDVETWAQSPLRSRFDVVVFSYEVGVRKPDRRIFEFALDALAVAARDAIFVGDGGSDEHRGARAVGLRTVFVTRLVGYSRPELIEARRGGADREFADVAAFVTALGL